MIVATNEIIFKLLELVMRYDLHSPDMVLAILRFALLLNLLNFRYSFYQIEKF